ncbi:MAG: hypothetical protein QOE11_921 [Solirubrobacteraceae bacterium]|jgi:hypothetical protein|nr:hypothetical protein [Solirubrobacteraceae bacterium]
MVDLGPIEADVPFAWDAASRLKHEFERAADELDRQLRTRRHAADHAEQDWHGRYSSVFEHFHMGCTINDGRGIAQELRRCAQMLEQLANLAREENDRRRLARAWKVKHDAWEQAQKHDNLFDDLVDVVGGDGEPKPPNVPELKPQPFVATGPPGGERG